MAPPPWRLAASEVPRGLLGAARALAPRPLALSPGDGSPVIVLPGLLNSDLSTVPMRRHLARLGHRVEGWRLGRNLGIRTVGPEASRLIARVASGGAPVHLVGISLGGLLARLVAHLRPDLVRSVVTVASPFAGDPRDTRVWRVFEWATGERLTDAALVARAALIATPPPVPATAVWSAQDGLVGGRACHDPAQPHVEVRSSHYLVQLQREVIAAVAAALASPPATPDIASGAAIG